MFKKKNKFKMLNEKRNKHLEDLLESFTLKYTTEISSLDQRRSIYMDLMKRTIEIVSGYYEEKTNRLEMEIKRSVPGVNGFFTSKVITGNFDEIDSNKIFDMMDKYNIGGVPIEN